MDLHYCLLFVDKYELLICRWPVFVCNLAIIYRRTFAKYTHWMREKTTVDWIQYFKVSKCFNFFFLYNKNIFFLECQNVFLELIWPNTWKSIFCYVRVATQMDGKTCCQNRRMNIIITFNRIILIDIQQLWIPTKCRTEMSARPLLQNILWRRDSETEREKKRLCSLDDAGRWK